MHLLTLLPLSSISPVLLTGIGAIAFVALARVAREKLAYGGLFGLSESQSLMNFSPLGSLECQCEPTDASAPQYDRRCSCRACGNAILERDSVRLYETLSRKQIRRVTGNFKRAGIDARSVALPATLTSLSGLHVSADLAALAAQPNKN